MPRLTDDFGGGFAAATYRWPGCSGRRGVRPLFDCCVPSCESVTVTAIQIIGPMSGFRAPLRAERLLSTHTRSTKSRRGCAFAPAFVA